MSVLEPETILKLAREVWNYHLLRHEVKKSDCILVLGSNDPRVAERGAELFLEGYAPLIVFSGGVGALTEGLYGKPEAEFFADIAKAKGVPEDSILIESRSTNTGENIQFTQQLLLEHRLTPQRFILVQKPFMERRSYATFKKHWPDKELIVTSPQLSFDAYPNEQMKREDVIHVMVGDLQRIKRYPDLGFQIRQEIPEAVWSAFEKLVSAGYTKHLIKEEGLG